MDEAQTTYNVTKMALEDFMMVGRSFYGFAGGEWLPYSPLDVNERVYVTLSERSFNAGDEESLENFIAELRATASKAPKKADVVIKLSSGYGYEDERADPEYEIGYWRDPTAKEKAAREETNRKIAARDEQKAREAADREREEFERLKAKFASDSDGNP